MKNFFFGMLIFSILLPSQMSCSDTERFFQLLNSMTFTTNNIESSFLLIMKLHKIALNLEDLKAKVEREYFPLVKNYHESAPKEFIQLLVDSPSFQFIFFIIKIISGRRNEFPSDFGIIKGKSILSFLDNQIKLLMKKPLETTLEWEKRKKVIRLYLKLLKKLGKYLHLYENCWKEALKIEFLLGNFATKIKPEGGVEIEIDFEGFRSAYIKLAAIPFDSLTDVSTNKSSEKDCKNISEWSALFYIYSFHLNFSKFTQMEEFVRFIQREPRFLPLIIIALYKQSLHKMIGFSEIIKYYISKTTKELFDSAEVALIRKVSGILEVFPKWRTIYRMYDILCLSRVRMLLCFLNIVEAVHFTKDERMAIKIMLLLWLLKNGEKSFSYFPFREFSNEFK